MQNIQVRGKLMGSIIVVTEQQTCHFDITKGDFSSAGHRQVRRNVDSLKRMTAICWNRREMTAGATETLTVDRIHGCLQSVTGYYES